MDTVSALTLTGDKATLRTCVDQTHAKDVNRGDPSAPVAQSPLATVSVLGVAQ